MHLNGGLSIFKFSLKKELTQKVEATRSSIPGITERIREQEKELDEAKRKGNQGVSALQQRIEDEKRTLSDKQVDLANVPTEKVCLERDISDLSKSITNLKDKLEKM